MKEIFNFLGTLFLIGLETVGIALLLLFVIVVISQMVSP